MREELGVHEAREKKKPGPEKKDEALSSTEMIRVSPQVKEWLIGRFEYKDTFDTVLRRELKI